MFIHQVEVERDEEEIIEVSSLMSDEFLFSSFLLLVSVSTVCSSNDPSVVFIVFVFLILLHCAARQGWVRLLRYALTELPSTNQVTAKSWFCGQALLNLFEDIHNLQHHKDLQHTSGEAVQHNLQHSDPESRSSAAESECEKVVRQNAKKLSGEYRENALIFAALAGQLEIMEILTKEEPWSLLWSTDDISRAQMISAKATASGSCTQSNGGRGEI